LRRDIAETHEIAARHAEYGPLVPPGGREVNPGFYGADGIKTKDNERVADRADTSG
jgi:hypothetical protein